MESGNGALEEEIPNLETIIFRFHVSFQLLECKTWTMKVQIWNLAKVYCRLPWFVFFLPPAVSVVSWNFMLPPVALTKKQRANDIF